jgi:hypothetical protein
MYGVSIIGFDAHASVASAAVRKSGILDRVVLNLLRIYDRRDSKAVVGSGSELDVGRISQIRQIGQFLEFSRRFLPTDQLNKLLLKIKSFPEVEISSLSRSSPASSHLKLYKQLEIDIRKYQEEHRDAIYEIINEYEGIRKGLYPVDIAIKKDNKIIGFIEVDGEFHYRIDKETKSKKLRRADQLKEFLYHYDYPDVPFIRLDSKAVSMDPVTASRYCLKKLL